MDIVEEAITLKMKGGGPEEQMLFNFETLQKEDIANLIASYSPVHSNWHRVGEAKIKQVRVNREKHYFLKNVLQAIQTVARQGQETT